MMIGREDVVIGLSGDEPGEVLDAVARIIVRHWKNPVFQDGDTGRIFVRFADVPLGTMRELLAYKEKAAFESWETLGADPSNKGSLIHVIANPEELTLVVDDQTETVARSVVAEVKSVLARGLPGRMYAVVRSAA